MNAERRGAHRRGCSLRFSYFYLGQRREAMLLNASAGGGFLNMRMFPPPGSVVVLEAFHEAARGLIIRFSAEVRHASELGFPVPGIGVQWRPAYCNRGPLHLQSFLSETCGVVIDPTEYIHANPDSVSREVIFDFQSRRFRPRGLGDRDDIPNTYHPRHPQA